MLNDLLHLFFPRICSSCGEVLLRKETVICLTCKYTLPRTNFHLYQGNPVEQLFWGRAPIKAAAAFLYFRKEGNVQNMLYALKYQNAPEVGEEIGKLYGQELSKSNFYNDSELILPVPLHPGKQKIRGYNQSESFGRGLERLLPAEQVTDVLIKREATGSQTRKSRFARWENVETVFEIKDPKRILNKNILLVDDVITTGATLESCTQHLLKAGANSVSIACIAVPYK
jgi:ComF family protein